MNIENIAEICHETNRIYCAQLGDLTQAPWCNSPEWQKQSAINGVKFHLNNLENGIKPSPSATHENWLKEKIGDGWIYGEIKNIELKTHPCCVPYDELPLSQRIKDFLFSSIIEAFYNAEKKG